MPNQSGNWVFLHIVIPGVALWDKDVEGHIPNAFPSKNEHNILGTTQHVRAFQFQGFGA